MQVRGILDTRHVGAAFECGTADSEKPGRAALDKLVHRLEAAAALPAPLRSFVVRRPRPMPWRCRAARFMCSAA